MGKSQRKKKRKKKQRKRLKKKSQRKKKRKKKQRKRLKKKSQRRMPRKRKQRKRLKKKSQRKKQRVLCSICSRRRAAVGATGSGTCAAAAVQLKALRSGVVVGTLAWRSVTAAAAAKKA